MDWGNEHVLELIQLLQDEPCIWHPKHRDHKNRNSISDAWFRINNNFSVPCGVEELKKKRNILLTQYRDCLKKMKESAMRASAGDEICRPSWFAFGAMHSYLGAVYDCHTKAEKESGAARKPCPTEPPKIFNTPAPNVITNESSNSPTSSRTKDRTDVPTSSNNHIENVQTSMPSSCTVQNTDDEFDLFARSIAIQLRKLPELEALDLMQGMQVMVLNRKRQLMNKTSSRLSKEKERKKLKRRSISIESNSNVSGDQDEEDPLTDDIVVLGVKREF